MTCETVLGRQVYAFVKDLVTEAGISWPIVEEVVGTTEVHIRRLDRDAPLQIVRWPGGLTDEQKAAIRKYLLSV